jgi:hypothetical protein
VGELRSRLARPSYEIQVLGALLIIGLLLRLAIAPYGEYVHDTNVAGAARSRFFFVFFSLLNLAMFIAVLLADLRIRFGAAEDVREDEERGEERSATATELSS